MKYYPIEMHTHTKHSDGQFEAEDLNKAAIQFGYAGYFMTDHNTQSSYYETIEKKLNQNIFVGAGIEWTTYHGHMLILGNKKLVDYRDATLENIDEKIKEVKQEDNVLVGIAHPFAIGNPVCTGCKWEYPIKDYNLIDYIEIYNSPNPTDTSWNEDAYELWKSLILKGYKIACVSGRDWHGPNKENSSFALTYIGCESLDELSLLKSLKKGNNYITLGPTLDFKIINDKASFHLGDYIKSGEYTLKISINEIEIPSLKNMNIIPKKILVINNDETVITSNSLNIIDTINVKEGTLRVEVYGSLKDKDNIRLITSSPCWII